MRNVPSASQQTYREDLIALKGRRTRQIDQRERDEGNLPDTAFSEIAANLLANKLDGEGGPKNNQSRFLYKMHWDHTRRL
jgi:hypothetical protein